VNGKTCYKKEMRREQEVVPKDWKWKGETFVFKEKEAKEKEVKFEQKQAPRTPNVKAVVECIDEFYRANGYSILPHDKKIALARAIHARIQKEGLYEKEGS
jgi:hypothetical protein